MRILFLWVGVAILAACSPEDWIKTIAPPEQQEIVRHYIEQLRSRDFNSLKNAADPSIAADFGDETLKKMADLIPAGEPTSVKLVGANQFSSKAVGTTRDLGYEYQFGEQFILIQVNRKIKDGTDTIIGFRVRPLRESLEKQDEFTLSGKSALQYGVLAAAILALVFSLYALIVCIRTKHLRRKWLWILFILFGLGKLSVNWATGQWVVNLLFAQLFSAGATAGYFSPWIISVSLPIGAAVFLSRRKELTAPGTVEERANAPTQ
jgi:hypothetical protein